ncbi:site-specific integrase [Haloarcula hispanica]|uniref:Integrase n=1 Tax=Haloarcula hispanica TaxID=51589 RepID=A0A482TJL1_HALHI|nr:site-specific integrase [Haloarcula hispanica]MCJ0620945.1 site-specific integrase [Haloarcula hispanica]RYJ11293.1 integrase [Haloarcula hispanica]
MSDDLDPITPEAALEYYVDTRQYDLRETTMRSHESRLRSFVDWLQDQGIQNMNDVDVRTIHEYRVYKREDNGDDDPCNSVTMQGQVSTIRRFLDYLIDIDAVSESLPERVRLPNVDGDGTSDAQLDSARAEPILEYLHEYRYASAQHITLLLMWRTSARRGGIRALDLDDFDAEDRALCFRHRPETGTPLKNGERGERDVALSAHVAGIVEDYISSPNRHSVEDDHGRTPLITTEFGRPALTTLQNWVYRLTRPCVIGEPCPHDYDPETCEYNSSDGASGCPSSVAPHAVRTGSITAHRDAGTPREVVSDRGDVSEKILEKHYDKASKRQRMRRRRDHVPEDI